MGKIYVVGMGPGKETMLTGEASEALDNSDTIVGYTTYMSLLPDKYKEKDLISTGMKRERERCEICLERAESGRTVSLICSGDSGIYGMASLMLEVAAKSEVEVRVVAGITAASSGAALLGAPLGHDFCVISLSDLLTPWELIERRLECAAKGDFCIAIYNPSSKSRYDYLLKACEILLKDIEGERVCGIARNIGRSDESFTVTTLDKLKDMQVDMFTTVFIGNSKTVEINGKMVTPRGYL